MTWRFTKSRNRSMALSLLVAALSTLSATAQESFTAKVQVHFSPEDSPTEALVMALNSAKRTIYVQAYSFTSAPIADALRKAHGRGVDVQVILDRSQKSEKYTVATFLTRAKIPVWIDSEHAIAHDKVMIIDGETVVSGSFNFTKSAEERNSENMLILESQALAKKYTDRFMKHKAHSSQTNPSE